MTKDEWIQKAIPFLKIQLWRVSDCLAMPLQMMGQWDDLIDERLMKDHQILTDLLKEVLAFEE